MNVLPRPSSPENGDATNGIPREAERRGGETNKMIPPPRLLAFLGNRPIFTSPWRTAASRSCRHRAARTCPGLGLALLALLALSGCAEHRSAPTHGDYVAAEPEPLACWPNLDGRIDSSEILTAYGETIRYLVTPYGVERPVNVAGTIDAAGGVAWDWATDYADDQVVRVVPSAVTDKWYAASFPGGQIVTPFDAAGRTESIARQDASSLPDPPEGRTLLVYDTPVAVLRFPVAPGQTFVSAASVTNGEVRGLPYAGQDVYEVTVDAAGEIRLPQITFTQAHRVRTRVTVSPAVGSSTSRRQVSFFAECFAEVARATSLADEPEPDFTIAAEIWRLGFE
jgi:hypothetical protein